MTGTTTRLLLVLLGTALSGGCASKEETQLEKYASATLTAGTGLGDLVLGQTTLGEFLHKVGKGRPAIRAGDGAAFEFMFKEGQIYFLFLITGDCVKEVRKADDLHGAVPDVDAYLARHPICRELTLSSICVKKRGSEPPFFQGKTERGVGLGSRYADALDHGAILERDLQMIAGTSQDDPSDVLEFRGIVFHLDRGDAPGLHDATITRITIHDYGDK